MNTLLQDLRLGLRTLLRQPLFTGAAVLVLALGIGANTALFSLIDAVLLRALPYPHADQLVVLLAREEHRLMASACLPDYQDWCANQQSLTDVALMNAAQFNFSTRGQAPERLAGATITGNYFGVLGVQPTLGRNFTSEEDMPGGPAVALLSDALWRSHFAADPYVVGREIILDDVPREIVGVLPPSVEFPRDAEVFVPLAGLRADKLYLDRNNHFGFVPVGRLKPGVSLASAGQEFKRLSLELANRYPISNAGRLLEVHPLLEYRVGDYRQTLYVLLGAVGCVLLVACANVASLQLARAIARRRELAVRAALGASRWRLVRQLLTESVLLGLLGGGAGLLLAFWGLDAVVALSPAYAPRFHDAHLNLPTLGFAALVALGAGLLAGVWPAWRITGNATMAAALHEENVRGGSGGASQAWARAGLVVTQIALAVVLLAGAGLLLRSFWIAYHEPLGFQPEGLLTADVSLPRVRYDSDAKQAAFFADLLGRVQALPGVTSAAITDSRPFGGGWSDGSFHVTNAPPNPPGKDPSAQQSGVSAGYFEAMKMPLLRGRGFNAADTPAGQAVLVIDDTFARRYFPDQNPVGQHLDGASDGSDPRTIIGVVPHVRIAAPGEQRGAEDLVQMYFCAAQMPSSSETLIVRSATGRPADLIALVHAVVQAIDPSLPLSRVSTMEENVAADFAAQRSTATLLGTFAGVALLLASIGLYGAMALSVGQRTRELGIRMALGSSRAAVLRLVMWQGALLVGVGLAVGLASALVSGRLLSSVLYGVSGADPLTLSTVSLVLGVAALLACLLPAQRAARIDPMVALRDE